MANNLSEFYDKKPNIQLNDCIKKFLSTHHMSIYKNGRPTTDYFKVRAYMKKLPEYAIRNIWLYLSSDESDAETIGLYDLEEASSEFIRSQQAKEEEEKQIALEPKNHEYDLEAFLNG